MSAIVCLRARTLGYVEGGGNLWVYLNWALGLRALGCQVIWLEPAGADSPPAQLRGALGQLKKRLAEFGLGDCLTVCSLSQDPLPASVYDEVLAPGEVPVADLLLDLDYVTPPELLGMRRVIGFRRSALVDIDPGLLQLWVSGGEIDAAPHDLYFTIGETVGTPSARFPDCGLEWHYTPPPIFLDEWPVADACDDAPYTTVSHWWGGGWVAHGGEVFNNDKRVSFEEYLDLPARTSARLELALCLGDEEAAERRRLEAHGWRVRPSWEVSVTPEDYRRYIQRSRGEFSCAKPSCMRLANAWISDRTICYLASGKPAVVQHTGDSRFLPDGEGLFRFRTPQEASDAFVAIEGDYAHHTRSARALAEEHFDARKVVRAVLERALS